MVKCLSELLHEEHICKSLAFFWHTTKFRNVCQPPSKGVPQGLIKKYSLNNSHIIKDKNLKGNGTMNFFWRVWNDEMIIYIWGLYHNKRKRKPPLLVWSLYTIIFLIYILSIDKLNTRPGILWKAKRAQTQNSFR